ncbi:MAG: hypothetical protein JEZ01_18480 [Labilibaculum sp.]|nr:hypothetical protein [Labilibaculum sp.]MBI9059757.1 hypothetical protein [Labilibaculum sp.]
MKLLIKLFGILIILAGISLLIKPEIILAWIENNMESTALYVTAIVARLALGVLFILAAKESFYPLAIKVFGYLFIAAAFILFIIGQGSFKEFINSLIPHVNPYAPIVGVLAIAFGAFLIYAFSRSKELN